MGNCPSTDDGHGSSSERMIGGGGGGATTRGRDSSWAAAFQAGGCHQTMLDDLLLGERKFLTNMQTLVDVFHAPLVRWVEQQEDPARAGTGCPVSRTDIAFVFSNLDELVVFSRRLLLALERVRVARSRAMLVVFLQLATSFKVYDAFMAGWNKRVECLNRMEVIPPVAMFFRACELQERCGGLHLRDLLAMPLQRVAQYRMLVESTVETCPPHLAVLHRELAQSLNIPFAVVHRTALERGHEGGRCSGATKGANGLGYLPTSMATPRPKIKEGRLTKMCQDGPRSIRFVLYPDELFHASLEGVTGQAQKGPQNGRHRGVGSVSLGHCFVIDGFDAPLHSSFVVACAGSSFMVKATDVAEKNEWVAALKATMDGLLMDGAEPASSSTTFSSSANGELSRQTTISKNATSATDTTVALTTTTTTTTETTVTTAKTTRGGAVSGGGGRGPTAAAAAGGGGGGSNKRGSAKIATTSWSPSSSSSSSLSGGAAGRKVVDAAASGGIASAGEEVPPPSPPHSARLGKGRGQGKRKGMICARAAWSRQGAVARLVYEKTTGRVPSAGRDPAGGGGGGRASGDGGTSGDTGNSNNVGSSSNGGSGGGSASESGVLPSYKAGGSGDDTNRGESCKEERESSSSSSPALEECSFWTACGSGDKATRWETIKLDSPSTEEVWSGSVGFRRALANPACLAEFRELLRTRHAIENLNFREAVGSYRALCCHQPSAAVNSDNSDDEQHKKVSDDSRYAGAAAAAAQDIVDRFVKDGGPEQVNLSAAGREAILSRQAESLARVAGVAGAPPPMEMFTEAWVEVSDLLQRGTFMRFRNSETFLRLKRTWAQELNGVLGASEFVLVTHGSPRASEGLAMLALRSASTRMPPRLPGAVETFKSSSSSSSPSVVTTKEESRSSNCPSTSCSSTASSCSTSSAAVAAAAAAAAANSSASSSSTTTSTASSSSSSSTSSSSSSSTSSSCSSSSSTSSLTASTASSRETTSGDFGLTHASLAVTTSTACLTPKSTGNASSSTNNAGGGTTTVVRQEDVVPTVFLQGKATANTRARKTPPLISAGPRPAVSSDRERVTPRPRMVRDASDPGPVAITTAKSTSVAPIGGSSSRGSGSDSGSNSGSNSGSGSSGNTSLTRGRLTRSSPKVAQTCAMPPLPLAPSLRNIFSTDDDDDDADGAPAAVSSVPETSSTKQALALAAPVVSSNAKTAGATPAAAAAASAASAAAAATASAAAALAAGGAKRGRKTASVSSSARTWAGGPPAGASAAAATTATATATATASAAVAVAAMACQNCGRNTKSKSKSSLTTTTTTTPPPPPPPPPASDDALYDVRLEISTDRLPSVADSPFVSPPHPPPRLVLHRHRRPSPRAASRTTQTPPAAIFRKKSTAKTPADQAGDDVVKPVRSRFIGTGARTGTRKDQVVDDIEVLEGVASSGKPKDQLVAAPLSGCGAELGGERRAVQGANGGDPQGPNGGPQGPNGEGRGGGRDSKAMTVSAVRAAVARRARYNKVRLMLQAPPGTGLGVKLVNNKGMATVCAYRSSLDGNYDSALDAGLKVGDVLVSVNGLHVLGNFDQAVQLTMRGQESGVLSLVVRRPHEAPAGGLFEERRSTPPGRRVYRTLDYRL